MIRRAIHQLQTILFQNQITHAALRRPISCIAMARSTAAPIELHAVPFKAIDLKIRA
jgi:hypothetical protein